MPTNDEIIEKIWGGAEAKFTRRATLLKLMDKARADTTSKHIGAIWNWWATKPQKSKNNATIRIITRTDIEELVRLIK
jgi:hypothetical protein